LWDSIIIKYKIKLLFISYTFLGECVKRVIIFFIVIFIPINVYAISDTAKSTMVMDMDSGRVLYEKNADEQRLIASITKIMTAVLAIENAPLDTEITVGEEVLSMYGSNIYIELGEKLSLRDLLYGLMLRSGNDAAIVIANNIASSEEEFVSMMNKKAKEIGMKNTIYRNPHGLDEETKNYSTARDMAILSSYAMTLKDYREISSTKKWTTKSDKKSYLWNNRNKLLYSYSYATGGKTGYTPSAGRTLVTTASKDNLDLTVVTLSDANEYITHESLYEYSFNKYNNYLIVDKNNFDIDDNFFKDDLYIKQSFTYPLSNYETEQVRVIVHLKKVTKYSNNDKVGEVTVTLDEDEIFNTDVYVKVKDKKESLLDKIKKFFKKF